MYNRIKEFLKRGVMKMSKKLFTKDEVDLKKYENLNQLKIEIDNYMKYYNNYRYQWNLNKMTPVQYRNHLII
ncbi:hypothetical protein GCM10008909_08310 [Hathewaya limosa]